jgi:hypothetical protein
MKNPTTGASSDPEFREAASPPPFTSSASVMSISRALLLVPVLLFLVFLLMIHNPKQANVFL